MKRSTLKALPLVAATAFFIFFSSGALSQVQTAKYISISSNCNAFYEYLPEGYSSGSSTYPLIIFLHGLGELGAGTSITLPKVLNNAIPNLIRQGRFPNSFYVNGNTYKFIVLSPQFVAWPTAKDVSDVIDYAARTYRVNPKRVYVTGLSMGGGGTWSIAADPTYNKKLAAIVPVCGALYPTTARAYAVADANIPVWATHNSVDPTVPVDYTNNYITYIKARNPNAIAKKTIFNVTGHDAWTTTYDPNFRENGLNVYEWMLQYEQGAATVPVVNQPPVANAGVDQAITLPANSARLLGSGQDADGTITSYLWTKVMGPAAGSISSTTTASPTLSGLEQGTYWYELKVTDDKGATATDRVAINVLAPVTQAPVVNAGSDLTITLPVNYVHLWGNATDQDGWITSAQWTQVYGPSTASITYPAVVNTSVTGLVSGTYIFQLNATDNAGNTSGDQVVVNVNAAAGSSAPSTGSGTTTKYINVNVYGGINPYNNSAWNNWNVVTATGTNASVNISSGFFKYSDGASSSIKALLSHSQQVRDNGTPYVTGTMAPAEVLRYVSYSSVNRTLKLSGLSVNKKYTIDLYASRNTNGYPTTFSVNGQSVYINTYNNASNKATFSNLTPNSSGEIVVEIYKHNVWNYLNGFTVTEVGSSSVTASARVTDVPTGEIVERNDQPGKQILEVYPNPVLNQLQLKLQNHHTGQLVVRVYDVTGAIKSEVRTTKNHELMQMTVPFEKLSTGTYFIRCTIGDWTETRQVLKIK
jgi:predicted esterase